MSGVTENTVVPQAPAPEAGTPSPDIVVDDGRSKLSDLWKKEDYWAIWLGFAILIFGYFSFIANIPEKFTSTIANSNVIMSEEATRAPFKTIEFYQAQSAKQSLSARSNAIGKIISTYLALPGTWTTNPIDAFYRSEATAQAINERNRPAAEVAAGAAATALLEARLAQDAAAAANFADQGLNTAAVQKIDEWRAADKTRASTASKANVKPMNLFPTLLVALVFFILLFGVGIFFMGQNFLAFAKGFVFVFFFAVLAFLMGAQSTMKYYGFGSEAWAIALGLILANTLSTPKFVAPALQTEFFIKTGLVLLGAEVLFSKIVAIGIPGIFVAWIVTPIVLTVTYIFGQKVLKIESKTLNITISADMSVCGTSAAIATAAASGAKKEELTLAIGMSLLFTAIMMIALPAFINYIGLPEVLGGAWIGGTVDSTGAVAAAGAFLGEKAMYVAATIKMIQNVMIGVTAFFVAIYFCTRVNNVPGRKVSAMEIWNRFPKFVLGFLAVSVIASTLSGNMGTDMSSAVIDNGLVKGIASPIRTWCFALAFTAIGLSTDFRILGKYLKGGKPVLLYVCGQSFNLCLTLLMAWIMFYKVFPDITAKI